jgi:hypothetical protein
VFQNFASFDYCLGFFDYTLSTDAITRIAAEIEGISGVTNVIIDCFKIDGTHSTTSELKRIVSYCSGAKKGLSIIRINDSLYEAWKIHTIKNECGLTESPYKIEDVHYSDISLDSTDSRIDDFDAFISDLYSNTILRHKIVDIYCGPNLKSPPYSQSSNVELPKYINIKKFIEEREISFLGIYLLCKKAIQQKLIPDYDLESRRKLKINSPVLFFTSMAGSYLASLFAKIALLDIAFLDHLGPKTKIYRRSHKNLLKTEQAYLLIADVVCLGSEIERARAIIEHEGGKISGVLPVVFVKVTDSTSESNVCPLFTLTKDNNTGIDYQIKTNF